MKQIVNKWSCPFGMGCQGVWILLLVLLPFTSLAQTSTANTQIAQTPEAGEETEQEVLTVGIGGTPPFLIENGEEYQGIVPDLWAQIALINDFEYEFVFQTQTPEALQAIQSGELDILIGPFSISSERLEEVDFTQPFFVSSVGILLPEHPPTLWSRVRPFFTRTALSSVGALLVCLFLVGNGMWLVERKENPEQFSREYWPGVGNGMWFAVVTLTTVGYGDRAPKTSLGRFIASIWMLISLITVSSLIGGLASAFTLALSKLPTAQITHPRDLRGTRMAVVDGSTGEVWATEYHARLIKRDTLEEAVALVEAGKAEGFIFDRPVLAYHLSRNPDLALRLADFTLSSENLGFVVPYGSPLTKSLDLAIVSLKENGTIQTISDRWLQGIDPVNEPPKESESPEKKL
ncbi:transporter substrate-binding domain-containing protein [Spirulina sp. CS-785/01]|uniref:transporter substrate-binding domain-containing protein n=1 Tax=Spirulina sp. CS-785/01 TaxID=3021716 RepID=UPI00232AE0E2|nr:transporter substrate-binding domain-containing protein [Spirulina sp. CS-785/01]MDB9314674.1 transporter substrate-binding domain-containing protein [Spirulina sp. CS-785/01]